MNIQDKDIDLILTIIKMFEEKINKIVYFNNI